jgi:hypothetical protein
MSLNGLIIGVHTIIYSQEPDADRAFLRDVMGLSHVDAGDGWLIFALPDTELAVHPSSRNDLHEIFFLCKDIQEFVAAVDEKGIAHDPIQQQDWGLIIHIQLPGGGKLGVYEPLHAQPKASRHARKAP